MALKGLIYNTETIVNDSMDNPLVDIDNSRIDQVFKKTGSALTINFAGVEDPSNQTPSNCQQTGNTGYY